MKSYATLLTFISILADGKFHSNKQLDKYLGIIQTEIDSYKRILQEWGIDIFVLPGKGCYLSQPIQLLNENFICSQIKTNNIKVLKLIDSTNQYLLERISKLHSGDSCITEYQQMGRGRRGHRWFSPFGANIYLSMYWCFKQRSTPITSLSLMISIVIAEVLREVGAKQIRLKWPNDIYLQNRKLAGILIELIAKNDNSMQTVIGIGINLAMSNFQTRIINQSWISLQEVVKKVNRNVLIVKLIKALHFSLKNFEKYGLNPLLPNWKLLDYLINRPAELIIGNNVVVHGVARGINSHGAILFEHNGIIRPWISNEISLRVTN